MKAVPKFNGIKRYWRLPFLLLGASALALLKMYVNRLVAVAPRVADSAHGRVYPFTQHDVHYLTLQEHLALVFFGAGVGIFILCFIAAAAISQGTAAFILPTMILSLVKPNILNPQKERRALILTISGASICSVCILIAYAISF